MDDRFLNQQRREPDPEFARGLRDRLHRIEDADDAPRSRFHLAPALAAVVFVALGASLFLVPSMRATAQSFLDLFRVRTFTAVPFDESRMERIKQLAAQGGQSPDPMRFGVEKVETLKDPGPARAFPTVDAAGAAAGLDHPRTAGWLPPGVAPESILVKGDGAARFTIETSRLRPLLDALDLRDVVVPTQLDGQQLTIRTSPALIQTFRGTSHRAHLLETTSPEVTLPSGVDLAQLGEIGLRVLGLDRGEAQRIAHSIDWRTTLVVPVPTNAASFRQISVQGHPGLLVTATGVNASGQRRRDDSLLLWTEGARVLALGGDLSDVDLVQMAQTLR